MSNVIVPELYEPARRANGYSSKRDAYLRAAKGVDPSILAADLGVSIGFVIAYQRKLGLRRMTTASDYKR